MAGMSGDGDGDGDAKVADSGNIASPEAAATGAAANKKANDEKDLATKVANKKKANEKKAILDGANRDGSLRTNKQNKSVSDNVVDNEENTKEIQADIVPGKKKQAKPSELVIADGLKAMFYQLFKSGMIIQGPINVVIGVSKATGVTYLLHRVADGAKYLADNAAKIAESPEPIRPGLMFGYSVTASGRFQWAQAKFQEAEALQTYRDALDKLAQGGQDEFKDQDITDKIAQLDKEIKAEGGKTPSKMGSTGPGYDFKHHQNTDYLAVIKQHKAFLEGLRNHKTAGTNFTDNDLDKMNKNRDELTTALEKANKAGDKFLNQAIRTKDNAGMQAAFFRGASGLLNYITPDVAAMHKNAKGIVEYAKTLEQKAAQFPEIEFQRQLRAKGIKADSAAGQALRAKVARDHETRMTNWAKRYRTLATVATPASIDANGQLQTHWDTRVANQDTLAAMYEQAENDKLKDRNDPDANKKTKNAIRKQQDRKPEQKQGMEAVKPDAEGQGELGGDPGKPEKKSENKHEAVTPSSGSAPSITGPYADALNSSPLVSPRGSNPEEVELAGLSGGGAPNLVTGAYSGFTPANLQKNTEHTESLLEQKVFQERNRMATPSQTPTPTPIKANTGGGGR